MQTFKGQRIYGEIDFMCFMLIVIFIVIPIVIIISIFKDVCLWF